MEPTITLELTATEVQNLGALLDVAIKAAGTQGAKAALPIVNKLETRVAEYNAANPAAPVEAVRPSENTE